MKQCNGVGCYRRTPEAIAFCCDECDVVNRDKNAVPFSYEHSAICDAREGAARSGVAMSPSRPAMEGEIPPLLSKEE